MKKLLPFLLILSYAYPLQAQQAECILKNPYITIHFGSGKVDETTAMVSSRYSPVPHYCPSDGHYTFTSNTSNCFGGDWHNLTEDHTPGDANGNMLLVNSSPVSGPFLRTNVNGLKKATEYEFSVWMMNVCRITDKCPFPLLPDITIHLQTASGKNVAVLATGEVQRVRSISWTQYRFMFTTPTDVSDLILIMVNHAPGGCGNDFVLDDITFRECVKKPPPVVKKTPPKPAAPSTKTSTTPKPPATAGNTKTTVPPAVASKSSSTAIKRNTPPPKPAVKKTTTPKPAPKVTQKPVPQKTEVAKVPEVSVSGPRTDSVKTPAVRKPQPITLPPPPPVLRTRTNTLVKAFQVEAGEIKVDLYDNGEIDGDTVSIYHNNRLIVSRARISQKAVSFRIKINVDQPHHELVMVAENLGSIPPNTSLMVVNAGDFRQEVFISSSKQKNAKVVFELK